jgi:hypothetical protein
MPKLELSYPAILQHFGMHVVKERTESRALPCMVSGELLPSR